jgi:type I restriction enzyme R subunit
MQQALAAKEAAWQQERQKLQDMLRSEKERQAYTQQRKAAEQSREFTCDDISEFQTRKLYIDLALEMAGWTLGTDCLQEVPVTGMPNTSGEGFVDYVLYSENATPLAVVEAKRTSIDPKTGKVQARLYADCLEKEHGIRPLIFYTNGFETWFWDDTAYPERRVFGFFSRDELDWHYYRKAHKKPIHAVQIDDKITNRVYQKKAVQAVCDVLQKAQRKALLVMATGSGKTRTAISVVDVLLRNGWIKHILFLADRRELVKQARKHFVNLLPNLTICNLLDSKDDPAARMVFSTYPTMMNAIDATRKPDGSRLFSAGHFDLIIVDESHRSIYKKYQDIFTYFDGYLMGLTATPKSDIDKNTYQVFELEDHVPTFAYEIKEAVKDGFLVPYRTLETKMKFLQEGIHYDELSDEEKEEWEDTFEEGVRDVPSAALNKFLFNSDTVDRVLQNLMTAGIHVQGGDLIGKSLIFAANTKHADFILERFNALYPVFSGQFCATIYNGIKYVDTLIDDLAEKEKYPQIAISVDMLDTGIDVPELVNLVFFKRVRSKSKFWQMIGRGTRLCPDLFGVGQDKDSFLIFDYCGNFEFFRIEKNGTEAVAEKSLTEILFILRVKIAQKLEHLDYQSESYQSHRSRLVKELHKAVQSIDEELFSSQMRIEYIHRYKQLQKWDSISDTMLHELQDDLAPIIPANQENELAKRFDALMYAIELATLEGMPAPKQQHKVILTAEKLEEKGNLAQVQQHAGLIRRVQTGEYWANADLFAHEEVRKALRDLLVLLEKENTTVYYTSFTDTVISVTDGEPEYGSNNLQNYRKKVNHYLQTHKHDLVVHKLRNNIALTESDVRYLEQLLWHELGTKEDYHQAFGDEPLVRFVAGLVGLERSTALEMFSGFMADHSLNSDQMEFVQLVVDHIVENGSLDKTILNDHPFNKHGSIVELFDGKLDVAKEIVKRIDMLNERVAVSN